MARFIVDLNEEWGMTVVMIEHDMGVVMDISHRVMVLDFGRKIAEGCPDEVLADRARRRAYLGRGRRLCGRCRDPARRLAARRRRHDRSRTCRQADTLPKLLRLNAREHGGEVALREKEFGVWRSYTWADYQARMRDFALGLREPRASAQAMSSRSSATTGRTGSLGEIAAHAVGAMSLGLYRDALDDEVALSARRSAAAKVVLAEDEEQVDKLLNVADRIPTLRHIIYSRSARHAKICRSAAAVARRAGAARRAARRARARRLWDRLVDATQGDDGRDPVHDLRHHRRIRSSPCCRPGALHPPLRRATSRSTRTRPGRRVRLACCRCPGSWSSSTRSARRWSAAHEGQLRRRTRDDHGRLPGDRPDLRALRAARVGADRRRCARPDHGRLAAQAAACSTSA